MRGSAMTTITKAVAKLSEMVSEHQQLPLPQQETAGTKTGGNGSMNISKMNMEMSDTNVSKYGKLCNYHFAYKKSHFYPTNFQR
jgi:hypothetical protein